MELKRYFKKIDNYSATVLIVLYGIETKPRYPLIDVTGVLIVLYGIETPFFVSIRTGKYVLIVLYGIETVTNL